ncbi:signal recognition particle subunit FFH/SRP54 (srp54) [Chitinophaga ginsengisegetis]|jgi:signal recognition particle subunit SRP54|uniref:Signal recognition particle protein n=1 Tax=Chitinophaga ginsengisegetis TaxID=393003 RepID=A0A1T5PD48_9BACT|nr:signal recognition particle protein [Chitinophaga ginsengisegetis]MDR6570187.1 signal recognition particle subunit SRP54 [Chitinophaga ginsengisegetis]MDR6649921.1 signal recognition particle subunit SRP54 [Chitinophaga ginsengisegetis]MDR6656438.1 signal recognition particle subunit SRP54 [Chitinophaga ginsengisegetis]SKD10439.1 signal recognition particle subunit FFH/SRP54 (srp54) [Chitinophaga ginsengisegetis]
MFESLSERLDSAFKQLKGEGRISEINIASTVKEIRRALVDADVNYKIAKEFTDKVKDKALGEKVLTSISPGQLMVKIVKDELAELMGGTEAEFDLKSNPTVVLIAGLQGSGKTTFSGKLGNFLKTKKNKKPLLVAADIYRPAAIDQLKVLGEQIGVEVYSEPENKNAVQIAENAIKHAKANNFNVIIIDTAGRLAVDEAMMNEVAAVKAAVKPQEILFVVDSMTGQDAVNTAKAFNERLDFTGVVLTKLDGDTRGGAALTIKYTVEKPIKFVSMGEKLDTLDVFYPERMAQRILGMGDITTLVERAQEQFNEEQAKKLEKKIRQNQFDFDDFKEQLQQIKKMGNLKDLMGMIPGVGKAVKDLDISDDAFKGIEAMINSMTKAERADPDMIDGSRRKRIAKGAGKNIQDVNQFMKQFEQMRQMMKMMNKFGGGGKGLKGMVR